MRHFLFVVSLMTCLLNISYAQNTLSDTSGNSPTPMKRRTIVLAELTDGSYVPVTIKNYRPGYILPLRVASDMIISDPNSPYEQVDARQVKRLWTIRNSPSAIPYGALIGGVLGGLVGLLRYDQAKTLYRDYDKMGAYTGAGIGVGAAVGILVGHIISPGGPIWKVIWPCSPSQ
jgi:hypothetical protein